MVRCIDIVFWVWPELQVQLVLLASVRQQRLVWVFRLPRATLLSVLLDRRSLELVLLQKRWSRSVLGVSPFNRKELVEDGLLHHLVDHLAILVSFSAFLQALQNDG